MWGVVVMLMLVASRAYATPADDDFAARCAAPGVLTCHGFDNTTTDIVQGVNLYPDGGGTYRAGLDTTIKASGAGSLRFDLPAAPHSGQNIAGQWLPPNGNLAMGGTTFKQNSTFYVSYRFRVSPSMLTNTWVDNTGDPLGWKVSAFHFNQVACTALDITQREAYSENYPILYTHCGAKSVYAGDDGNYQAPNITTPKQHQQQGNWFSTCTYPESFTGPQSNCFHYVANEWMTFKYKVSVGTWGGNDSRIEGWVSTESSQAWRKVWDVSQYPLTCNNMPGCTGDTEGFNNITLLPYMTGLNPATGSAASSWYDELIVSTQDIAAPIAAGTGHCCEKDVGGGTRR